MTAMASLQPPPIIEPAAKELSTPFSAREIAEACAMMLGIGAPIVARCGRTAEDVLRREAIAGASYFLAALRPSLPELGQLVGTSHQTAMGLIDRYRAWPQPCRIDWSMLAMKAALNRRSHGPLPDAPFFLRELLFRGSKLIRAWRALGPDSTLLLPEGTA